MRGIVSLVAVLVCLTTTSGVVAQEATAKVTFIVGPGGMARTAPMTECRGTCVFPAVAGSTYFFPVAEPDKYFKFVGWTGGCSGTGNCTLKVPGDITVGATFQDIGPAKVNVSLSATSGGGITYSGKSCNSRCTYVQRLGETFTFKAVPAYNQKFTGWTDHCSGMVPECTLKLSGDVTIGARFAPKTGGPILE